MLNRLKELRKEKNITQADLGKIINQSKSNVSKYETGMLEPNIQTLTVLSNYFEVSIDYLLGISNVRTSNGISTIAAHKDDENWSDEEIKEIENFKEFVRMKRNEK